VAEILEDISSSEYAIDGNVSRLMWMPWRRKGTWACQKTG